MNIMARIQDMSAEERTGIEPSQKADPTIDRVPERGLHTDESREKRAQFLENKTAVDLDLLRPNQFCSADLVNNIESFVGAVEVPVGIAGPLHIQGSSFDEVIYAPVATSEGALVASISRGAFAINQAGGVFAKFIKQEMTRTPVFTLSSMQEAYQFSEWCQSRLADMKTIVKKYSNFADLVSLTPQIVGRSASIKFSYQTGDAAGQNMTTTCTWHTCQWLLDEWRQEGCSPVQSFTLEGNGSCDKKVSLTNFIEGRGCEAVAECVIPGHILKRVLKVTPVELFENVQRSISHSITSGMIGYNINVSNVIAGIFTATGQDIACVHESSLAHLNLEIVGEDLYSSIRLPSLTIGTVGGGTSLPAQKKMLQVLNCYGAGKVQRFAEIIAGFALALELSTSSAVTGGQFAIAHERLGRNRPVNWLKQSELENEILPGFLASYAGKDEPRQVEIQPCMSYSIGSSIVTELCASHLKKYVGLFPYDLSFVINNKQQTLQTLVKIKALDQEVLQVGATMAGMCSRKLAELFKTFGPKMGFTNAHKKELAIYTQNHQKFTDYVPKCYLAKQDDEREIYILLLERLKNTSLKDSTDDIRGWQHKHIKEVLKAASSFHSLWYDRDFIELIENSHVEQRLVFSDFVEMKPFFKALLLNARNEFPEIVRKSHVTAISKVIEAIPKWAPDYCGMPATLIHNDFNPRNIAFRSLESGPRAVIYDWELAIIGLPQRDIAELLCFVLEENVEPEYLSELLAWYRNQLSALTGKPIDRRYWMKGFKYALYDFIIGRLMMYLMAHTFKDYKFMERIYQTSIALLKLAQNNAIK